MPKKPTKQQIDWLIGMESYLLASGVVYFQRLPCGCKEAATPFGSFEEPCEEHRDLLTASGTPRKCACGRLQELTEERAEFHRVANSWRWPEVIRQDARQQIERLRQEAHSHVCR